MSAPREGWRLATLDDCRNWRGDLDWAAANFLIENQRKGYAVWFAGGLLIVS